MKNKKVIVLFGVLLFVAAIFGVIQLVGLFQSNPSSLGSLESILIALFIILDIWAGSYLIKSKEKVYQALNIPVSQLFKKRWPLWLILYAIIITIIVIAEDVFKW
jgi:hypothetical protein